MLKDSFNKAKKVLFKYSQHSVTSMQLLYKHLEPKSICLVLLLVNHLRCSVLCVLSGQWWLSNGLSPQVG